MKLKKTRLLHSLSTKIALGMMLALPTASLYAETQFYGGLGAMASFVQAGDFTPFGEDATFTGNDNEKHPSFDTQIGGESFIGAMFGNGNFGAELSFTMKSLSADDTSLAEGIIFPTDSTASNVDLGYFDYTNMVQNGARISGVYKMNFKSFTPYISAGIGTNVISGVPLSKPMWGFALGGKLGADFKLSNKISLYAAYDLDATMSAESKITALISGTARTTGSSNNNIIDIIEGMVEDIIDYYQEGKPGDNSIVFKQDFTSKILGDNQAILITTEAAIPHVQGGSFETDGVDFQTITNVENNIPVKFRDGSNIFTTYETLKIKIPSQVGGTSNPHYALSEDGKEALILLTGDDLNIPQEGWKIHINDINQKAIEYLDTAGIPYGPEGKPGTAEYYLNNMETESGDDIYPFIDGTCGSPEGESASKSKNNTKASEGNEKAILRAGTEPVAKPQNPLSFSSLLTHNIVVGVKFNF